MQKQKFLRVVDNFLSEEECKNITTFFLKDEEKLDHVNNGLADYHRGIIIDDNIAKIILERALPHVPQEYVITCANNHIRFARYFPGGEFKIHKDGINVDDKGNKSVITVNIFLNENFTGGATDFCYENNNMLSLREHVEPNTGRAAIFDSQQYHRGCKVESGEKMLLRTDLMTKI